MPDPDESKKLFHVSGTLDIDLVALATDEDEAVEIAKKHWSTEVSDAGLCPDKWYAQEVRRSAQVKYLGDLMESIPPYGIDDESSPQLSISEYLDKQGIVWRPLDRVGVALDSTLKKP